MKKKNFALLVILAALVMVLGGCSGMAHPDESKLPWSRPAAWEGSVPGMGV